MKDDASVHALSVPVEYGGLEMTITPVAIETDRGVVLVDVGPAGAVDALAAQLDSVGHSLAVCWLVVCTHHDGDHVGGLAELRERTDVVVAAHRDEAPFVDGRRRPQKASDGRYLPTPVDVELVDGVRFASAAGPVRVVATPGHTPGHLSLYLPDHALCLAGDALVADDSERPLAGPKPEYTADLDRARESVERLAELDVDHTVCYHGGHVAQGSARIREIADEMTA